MKVSILDNGYLLMDKNILLKDAVLANADEPDKRCELVKCPVMMVLIEHEQGKILLDLGCHPDAGKKGYWPDRVWKSERYFHEPHQTIEAQLALCGVTPEQIDTVVLSHLHEDHTGNSIWWKAISSSSRALRSSTCRVTRTVFWAWCCTRRRTAC